MKLNYLALFLCIAGCSRVVQANDHVNMIDGDNVNLTAERFLADFASKNAPVRTAAHLYLLGVLDASEGRDWCSYSKLKTASIDDFIFDNLRKKPPEALKARAANLIVEALNKSFPCGAAHEADIPKTQK